MTHSAGDISFCYPLPKATKANGRFDPPSSINPSERRGFYNRNNLGPFNYAEFADGFGDDLGDEGVVAAAEFDTDAIVDAEEADDTA